MQNLQIMFLVATCIYLRLPFFHGTCFIYFSTSHNYIITQVIIEILVISLVKDYVISCYNHLTRGDYSGSTNFQTAAWRFVDVSEEEISTMKENAIPKGIKDAAKSRVTLFEGRIWKFC